MIALAANDDDVRGAFSDRATKQETKLANGCAPIKAQAA